MEHTIPVIPAEKLVNFERVVSFMEEMYFDRTLARNMALLVLTQVQEQGWLETEQEMILDGNFNQIDADRLKDLIFRGKEAA